jgi:hypothetical protein
MVKVRIEYKGQVREFEGNAVAAFIPFSDSGKAHWALTGETSADEMAKVLSAGIPYILERVSDSRMEYVDAMIKVHDEIDKKIKEELKAGGIHPLVDVLVKAMGEELEK